MIRLWGQRMPKESVNKYLYYVFNTMRQVPFYPVCQGWTDRLAIQAAPVTPTVPANGGSLDLSNDNDANLFKDGGGAGTVQIDGEQIAYTSRSGRTISGITRGVNGSTAAAHSPGSTVYEVLKRITCIGPENPQVAWNDGTGASTVRLYPLSAINNVYMGGARKLDTDPPTHSVQLTNSTFVPGANVSVIVFDMTTLVLNVGRSGAGVTQSGVERPDLGSGGIGLSGGGGIIGASDAPRTPEEWSRFAWNILRQVAWMPPPEYIFDASKMRTLWAIRGGGEDSEDPAPQVDYDTASGGDDPYGNLDLPGTGVTEPWSGGGPGVGSGKVVGGGYQTPSSVASPSYGGQRSSSVTPTAPPRPTQDGGLFSPLGQVQPTVPIRLAPPPQQVRRIVTLPPAMIGAITADVTGAVDDSVGTITGAAGALLQYPAHIIKLIMAAGYGENTLARYADWSEAHTRHATLDIQWNFIFEPMPFTQFQEQAGLASICDLYEDNVKWYLKFRQRRAPVLTVDVTNVIGQPQFTDPTMRELTTELEVSFGIQPWTDGSFTLGDSPYLVRFGALRGRALSLPWIATVTRANLIARAWYPQWDGPRQIATLTLPHAGLMLQKTDTIEISTPLMSTFGPGAVLFEIRAIRHRLNEGLIEVTAVEGDSALTFIERLLMTETLRAMKGPSLNEVQSVAEAFNVHLIPGQEIEILTEVLGTFGPFGETEAPSEVLHEAIVTPDPFAGVWIEYGGLFDDAMTAWSHGNGDFFDDNGSRGNPFFACGAFGGIIDCNAFGDTFQEDGAWGELDFIVGAGGTAFSLFCQYDRSNGHDLAGNPSQVPPTSPYDEAMMNVQQCRHAGFYRAVTTQPGTWLHVGDVTAFVQKMIDDGGTYSAFQSIDIEVCKLSDPANLAALQALRQNDIDGLVTSVLATWTITNVSSSHAVQINDARLVMFRIKAGQESKFYPDAPAPNINAIRRGYAEVDINDVYINFSP